MRGRQSLELQVGIPRIEQYAAQSTPAHGYIRLWRRAREEVAYHQHGPRVGSIVMFR
jgi:hypothetical protein